jgi:hypothetical protein
MVAVDAFAVGVELNRVLRVAFVVELHLKSTVEQ